MNFYVLFLYTSLIIYLYFFMSLNIFKKIITLHIIRFYYYLEKVINASNIYLSRV